MAPFVVMAKPVGPACNLACGYCYYLGTERLYAAPHPFRMPDALLERFVRGYIASSPGPVVSFVWHGGEPTLAGLDFFRRAVALQKRWLPRGWSCWNNLQTNGVLLDDEWCAFLAEEGFDVGVSVDGTRALHDARRRDHAGNGSYDAAAAAVGRLLAHGVRADLLCTVTSDIEKEPLAAYRALRALGTGWAQFIPVVRRAPASGGAVQDGGVTPDGGGVTPDGGGVTPDSCTPSGFGRFLRAVFDEWACHDAGRFSVQIIEQTIAIAQGAAPSVCQQSPVCGRVLVLEHDGAVYACDHFVSPAHRLGDLVAGSASDGDASQDPDTALATLADSPAQRRFGRAKRDRLPERCLVCRWLAYCNGACPKDRFIGGAGSADGAVGGCADRPLSYLCDAYRAFFDHAAEPVAHYLRLRATSPASFAADFTRASRARVAAAWGAVGRNDPCPCGSGRKAKSCCLPLYESILQ